MTTQSHELAFFLKRGDVVTVTNGQLAITPASGKPVPSKWLAKEGRRLIAEAAGMTAVLALEFISYSTGNYGDKRFPGVTLQFRCLVSGESFYTIFNAHTRRSRTTKSGKAGAPLPSGQFRVSKGSSFCDFWQGAGLSIRRLSDLHDYMGNLRKLVFTARIDSENRLYKESVRPLNIGWSELYTAFQSDSIPTRITDNETAKSLAPCGFQAECATGQNHYGNTDTTMNVRSPDRALPELQSNEAWLEEYDRAPPLHTEVRSSSHSGHPFRTRA